MNDRSITNNHFHLDANVIVAYLLDEEGGASELQSLYFSPSNPGDKCIYISTNELGEAFKRLFRQERNQKGCLFGSDIDHRVHMLHEKIKDGYIHVLKFDDVIKNSPQVFVDTFTEIIQLDNRIQKGDVIHLTFFALSENSGIYLTNDSDILTSSKVLKYFEKKNKKISEPFS